MLSFQSLSSSSHLINVPTHPFKLRLPRAHQIPYLSYVTDMLVPLKLSSSIGYRLRTSLFRDAVERADDGAVQAEDTLALEKVV